jgi:alkylation response protein AidB-like acyl-CoA dehydrogenase
MDAAQHQLVEATRDALRDLLPLARFRAPEGAATEAQRWTDIAALGWLGLGLPEAVGGAGAGLVEEALLHLELGRHLASPALIAAAIGARCALTGGDAALARGIVAGDCRLGLALRQAEGALVAAGEGAARWVLRAGDTLALVAAAPAEPLAMPLDATVPLARTACDIALSEAQPAATLDLLLAAQLAGIAAEAAALAVEHARTREQFGKPIGAFQAVAHHCANMALRARAARAQVLAAATALEEQRDDAAFQLAAAALLAGEAAPANAALAIRVHGAMGYAAEAPLHHLLKRAHLLLTFTAGRVAQRTAVLAHPLRP